MAVQYRGSVYAVIKHYCIYNAILQIYYMLGIPFGTNYSMLLIGMTSLLVRIVNILEQVRTTKGYQYICLKFIRFLVY